MRGGKTGDVFGTDFRWRAHLPEWDDALSHLRAALEFMRSIDCADLSPHDVAELESLIGRVRTQRDAVNAARPQEITQTRDYGVTV